MDSLVKLDFEELHDQFYDTIETNPILAKIYAKAYLQKGKNTDSVLNISKGFYYMSRLHKDDLERRFFYVDSAIGIIKKSRHKKFLTFLYTHKGAVYEKKGVFNKAIDHYLEGLEFAKKTNHTNYVILLNRNIAILKRQLGKYEEAKLIFRKCLAYEEPISDKTKNNYLKYLLTTSELVTTYRKNKEIDSAISLNNKGIIMSKGKTIQCLFKLNQGILQYYSNEYENAIKNINLALDTILKPENQAAYLERYDLLNGYLFIGSSYNALSKKELAISYYKKVDSVIQKSNYVIPETRLAYSEIISYYKSINDRDNQLYYINRLLYNDSLFHSRYITTTDKLNSEFDTPILISQKENIIHELKVKNNQSYYVIFITSIVIIIITSILFNIYRKNKRYKKHFDELMVSTNNEVKRNNTKINEENTSIGISKEVVKIILKALNEFEKNNGFLELNITSGTLAKKINTNSKYLTKVIKFYRDKSFSPYINDLRVDYIVERLKTDKKIQKYTIKALANEAGFNSTEVFSKSFFKRTGIYPSYFIKKLNS
ncbi:AraC family transcriptional regulator [Aquimarina spinulae]|uniref:AraC family transcriptional regulator n=1 Tax=Aquimarina spinulae TaxID=1192023 RepID=UPI00104DEEFE|nr:AraC family transcriptional regulator [Aquimarina spinulae]